MKDITLRPRGAELIEQTNASSDSVPSRWRQIASSQSFRIFSATLVIGSLTFVVKIASMIKDLAVAASFGTSDVMDAFLVAYLLPSFVIGVLAGSLNAALIPTYIEVRDREGRERAQRLFSGVMALSLALLAIATVLLAIAGPYVLPFLGSGFGPAKTALATRLFYVMLPSVAISGLATLWSALLNAHERFVLVAIVPVTLPIASLAALPFGDGQSRIYALAVGLVVGMLVQVVILGHALRRSGMGLVPRWSGPDPAARQVIGQYLPMIAASLLMNSSPVIDQSMAATLGSGSVAELNYANKIVALILGIGTLALGTAVLPYFSKMVAATDWAAIRRTLNNFTGLILAAAVPVTLIMFAFSEFIVRLLYERGAFTAQDTHRVGEIQALYALQIPFYSLGILFVRLISSLKANRLLMYGTAISFALNISLDYLLKGPLGVAGIALSTTLVYVCSFAYLGLVLRHTLRARQKCVSH